MDRIAIDLSSSPKLKRVETVVKCTLPTAEDLAAEKMLSDK